MEPTPDPQRWIFDVRHPNCWALSVTEEVDAGLLNRGVSDVERSRVDRFTGHR